jgi:GntR family transcriptional regulator/MocR family aminotransferase
MFLIVPLMGRSSRQISLPFIKVDRKASRPVYEQLYEGIRAAILNGILRPNDRLPATRLIAEELGVSRNIVVMAFEQLGMEGYIQSRSGSGSFVAAEIPMGMEKAERGEGAPEREGRFGRREVFCRKREERFGRREERSRRRDVSCLERGHDG